MIDFSNPAASAQARVQENMAKIASVRYPDHEVITWTQRDVDGIVYGKEKDISTTIASSTNETILVEALYSVGTSEIGYYQRLLEFYNTKEHKQSKLGLVTCKIDATAEQVAKERGFDVMLL
mmetsp:Transcript_10178/g.12570  ORF Transcript_10178/g.12570 Transcript_10178/m.12570 type:complete len:122 (-) Transcript_10178:8-373(-)